MSNIHTGFETIGNATLIIHDTGQPLLATDVWLDEHPCYFGSWSLPFKVPDEQRQNIKKCPYIFISHFHPDHLNLASLRNFKHAVLLIAQHWGSRVEKELRGAGFRVVALPSRKWHSIGNNTRILLFNNSLHDSAILVELTAPLGGKTLVANLNDSGGLGFEISLRKIARQYSNSFYLGLHGYGDADMINLFDIYGSRLHPVRMTGRQIGREIQSYLNRFKLNVAIPFSSFHQYQRRDSTWANQYTTPIDSYYDGFQPSKYQAILPPFIKVHLKGESYQYESINPPPNQVSVPIPETVFGDDWSTNLSQAQLAMAHDYFSSIQPLRKLFHEIQLCVGNATHTVFRGSGKSSIRFQAPSASLMRAIRTNIFDDLLIANFMRVYLDKCNSLYRPNFNYLVTKYADNGGIRTHAQLKAMFSHYETQQPPLDWSISQMRKLKRLFT